MRFGFPAEFLALLIFVHHLRGIDPNQADLEFQFKSFDLDGVSVVNFDDFKLGLVFDFFFKPVAFCGAFFD